MSEGLSGEILLPAGSLGSAWLTRRSVGDGLGLLLFIGSVYGLARCRVLDGFTHFWFDASSIGAYAALYSRATSGKTPGLFGLKRWIFALAVIPLLLILLSPFLDAQPVLVQLLGLRPALFFLPFLLVGGLVQPSDARQLARWAVGSRARHCGRGHRRVCYRRRAVFSCQRSFSNHLPLSRYRRERTRFVFPRRSARRTPTEARWSDSFHSWCFCSSHETLRERALGAIALGCAALGVFACGARLPFIGLLVVAATIVIRGVRRNDIRVAAVAIGAVLALTVSRDERLQRFETLSDSAYVGSRFEGSVNENLLEILAEHPVGRGLGSAVGTSIPYFLAAESRPQVGLENEFARIGIEQGLVGLLLWLAFGALVLLQSPKRLTRFGGVADASMSGLLSLQLVNWVHRHGVSRLGPDDHAPDGLHGGRGVHARGGPIRCRFESAGARRPTYGRVKISWLIVAGGAHSRGGQNRANLELVSYLSRNALGDAHLVTHEVAPTLLSMQGVHVSVVRGPWEASRLAKDFSSARRGERVRGSEAAQSSLRTVATIRAPT